MISWIHGVKLITWLIVATLVHEWGHAWVAKKRGIFVKYILTPLGAGVKLTRPFPYRNDYMSGIYASMLTLPLWLIMGLPLISFVVYILLLGIFDILLIFNWQSVQEEIELHQKLDYYVNKYGNYEK